MNSKKQKISDSFQIPLLLATIMWAVKLLEYNIQTDFGIYGIMPRTWSGLIGIVAAPFLHGDWGHIMSNTPAIVVLGMLMLYFYPSIAKIVMLFIAVFSGILVWLFARESYHIGDSGLVYGFAFFLFFSAVFRRDSRSLAISLFIILFYGSIVWGLLPLQNHISFESHIAGAFVGMIMAYLGRNSDVHPIVTSYDVEEENKSKVISYQEYMKALNERNNAQNRMN